MRIYWFFIWINLNPLHPRKLCAKLGWNWLWTFISPWKRAGPFIWTNLNSLHPRKLCAKFGWNWINGSGEEDFLILSIYFHYFVIISPWKRARPFIWTNLNPLYPRKLCAKFGWNWPSGSGEEDENVKSLRHRRQRRRTTDKFWSEKLTWAFGSGKLKMATRLVLHVEAPQNVIILRLCVWV